MDYKVITSSDLDILVTSVNSSIKAGWVCQGGVAVTDSITGGYVVYHQAMVKTNVV